MSKEKTRAMGRATPEQIKDIISELQKRCKELEEGKFLKASSLAKEFNFSMPLIKDIYIRALEEGFPVGKIKFDKIKDSTKKSSNSYINNRGSLIIGSDTIKNIYPENYDGRRFTEGDTFKIEFIEGKITLTLVEK